MSAVIREVYRQPFFKKSVFREVSGEYFLKSLIVMERKRRNQTQHDTTGTDIASELPSPCTHQDLSLSLHSFLACRELLNPILSHRLQSPRVSIMLILAIRIKNTRVEEDSNEEEIVKVCSPHYL